MSAQRTFEVPASAAGERLDRWLANQLSDVSRSQLKRWIDEGRVLHAGVRASKAGELLAGDELVTVYFPEVTEPEAPSPEAMPLDVLYEDEDVVVINKPAGLVVHPGPGHPSGTLVNALLARYPDLHDPEQPKRPGIVHRLDKDTSGVLIAARSARARRFLQRQFRRRTVEKEYLALIRGVPEATRGVIEASIGRDPNHRQRQWVVPGGRPATTEYELQETFATFSLLRIKPITGRTHQIRVHLAAIGYPVVNDPQYGTQRGAKELPIKRQCLHAWKLTVMVPAGDRMTFEASMPEDMATTIDVLRSRR